MLGVGGYRLGFLWLALALPVLGGALTFAVLAAVGRRALWVAAVVLIGLTASARLVDSAPDSAGRLRQRLDGLALPFFAKTGDVVTGHGWCRPHCPEVTRRYRTPAAAPRANELTIILAMQQAGLLDKKLVPPPLPAAGRPLTFRTSRVVARIEVATGNAHVSLAARRG